MPIKQILPASLFIMGALWAFLLSAGQTAAQSGGQDPTPLVITLTPDGPTTTPTPAGGLLPDRFEPNDTAAQATTIGWQTESGLTLIGADVDAFTGYLKAGQIVRLSATVYDGLDTRLKLYWAGELAAENDDHTPTDLGSAVLFTAPTDGWYVTLVEKAAVADGRYDLTAALLAPTVTPTPSPSVTPSPTLSPSPTGTPAPTATPLFAPDLAEPNDGPAAAWPIVPGSRAIYTLGPGDVDFFTFIAKAGGRYSCETVTDQVDTLLTITAGPELLALNDDRALGRIDSYAQWTAAGEQTALVQVEARGGLGQYELACQSILPPAGPPVPPAVTPMPTAVTPPLTMTQPLTTSGRLSLTVRYLGQVPLAPPPPPTHIRLLVYYDANHDRQPGPGEGIANVSVLAVDAQGRRLARVFTNAQGEAIFNLSGEAVARVIVPFVPGWSARVRGGEGGDEIVLGLPAVRLPVFFPVQNRSAGEE